MTVSKRSRIYTAQDVEAHASSSSCWVSYKSRVFDVTEFLADHPGGDDLILEYAGKDVGPVMGDVDSHAHSDAAYSMLDEFAVGRLGTEETIVRDGKSNYWEVPDDFHPDETDLNKDYAKNQFLDLNKPLIWQLWQADMSKAYYLRQVHQPRHLKDSARLFASPYLEIFTLTEWWVVPAIWLPIAFYLSLRSILSFAGPLPPITVDPRLPIWSIASLPTSVYAKALLSFLTGNILWTILEYTLHRFLFHIDEMMPEGRVSLMLHFLLHGIHHYLPMDRLRLVMPPILFATLEAPFSMLIHRFLPPGLAYGIQGGAFTFYVFYDCFHYALHHTKLPAYMTEMKKYHLAHHYKNFELGFGVTSKIWDYVFNTVLSV